MKKFILTFVFTIYGFSVQAQMPDTLGSLIINGEIANEGVKALNKGQKALNQLQFQQDLSALIAEIQMNYMGNYSGLSKQGILSEGIRGVDWDVSENSSGGFIISVNNLDIQSCFALKNQNYGAKKVEINDGKECQGAVNNIKMYFD